MLEFKTNYYPSSSYQLGVPDFRLISAQNRYIGPESYDIIHANLGSMENVCRARMPGIREVNDGMNRTLKVSVKRLL